MTAAPLLPVPVAELDDERLRRCYEQLLQPAFPPAQLMTLPELREARSSGTTDGLVLLDEGEPVAVVLTEDHLDGRVRLLAYLVVAEELRGTGAGGRLLEETLRSRPPGCLVLTEVDDPRCVPVGPHGDPVRRLRFYERAGARLLPLPYVQPSLRPGSPRVDGLLLIALRPDGDAVDGELVAAFLDAYYEACEGVEVVAHDPGYRALRSAALAGGRLPLVPLSELDRARPVLPPTSEVGSRSGRLREAVGDTVDGAPELLAHEAVGLVEGATGAGDVEEVGGGDRHHEHQQPGRLHDSAR